MSLCILQNSEFSQFADDMAFLNGFYIESKYPIDIPFEPSSIDVQRAISCASQIINIIEKKLQ